MGKRPNLAEVIQESTMERKPSLKKTGQGGIQYENVSRAGKSFLGGYFAPEVAKQMKFLAVEQETTIQGLMGEALNLLFGAYGKPEIAPPRRKRIQ